MNDVQSPLVILRGQPITWKTTKVVVGEAISLTVTSAVAFSNIQWTVPGNVVAGFTNTSTHGESFPLTNKTNSAVIFFWVEGGSTFDVECTAVVNGNAINAKSTFIVIPAVGSLNAVILTNVSVDAVGPNVRLGDGAPPGILFTGVGQNLVGPLDQGKWEFCQVMLAHQIRANVATNVTGGNPVSLVFSITNGLDAYPYPVVTNYPASTFLTVDSPISPTGDTTKFWRDDSFAMYWMFTPTNVAASIPVPVRKVSWSWGCLVTNAVGLASSYTNITGQNQPATVHPYWTTNLVPVNYHVNSFHYP